MSEGFSISSRCPFFSIVNKLLSGKNVLLYLLGFSTTEILLSSTTSEKWQ